MSDFLQQALRLEPDSVPAWLSPFRSETGESRADLRLPTRRVEEWKYTSLKALEEQPFYPSASDREDLQKFISNMQLWQKVCREVVMV